MAGLTYGQTDTRQTVAGVLHLTCRVNYRDVINRIAYSILLICSFIKKHYAVVVIVICFCSSDTAANTF
jgi:hypothetical protein